MAEINYNLNYDDLGNFTVTQEVIVIDVNDRVTFTASGTPKPGMVAAIRYGAQSPFDSARPAPVAASSAPLASIAGSAPAPAPIGGPGPNVVVAVEGRQEKHSVRVSNRPAAPKNAAGRRTFP